MPKSKSSRFSSDDEPRPGKSYSLPYRRALSALPILLQAHPNAEPTTLLTGLQALAASQPSLRGTTLGARALHETNKYDWAFPDDAMSSTSIALVASHGFKHGDAILAKLRRKLDVVQTKLDDTAVDKLVGRAFRSAVKARKAGNASLNIERAALKEARAALLAIDEDSTFDRPDELEGM